jgi:SAM-dependent methyltransferase
LRLHIGHHFFGAGNLGDDLMLAGFLDAVSASGRNVHLTCASAFNIASQRRRFPQVEWLDYDPASRESAIRSCDAWVGVGDTPFQIVVGPWFLEHLAAELEFCRKHDTPMYFIGIGVNEPAALHDLRARAALDYATHLWTRDERSAELISAAGAAAKVSPAADLAHIYLSHRPELPVEIDAIGYVLNFEDSRQFTPAAFGELADRLDNRRQRWLVQEDRHLDGSERVLYEALPPSRKAQLDLRAPDYPNGTLDSMLASWGSPGTLITSRYHASVIGAWSGARVVAIERSDKIRALAAQSGIVSVPDLRDAGAALSAIDRSRPVARSQLMELASRATRACEDMIEEIASTCSSASNRCELASVEAKDSPRFCAFMSMMNAFATSFGLRTFTTWSKIWEYPWLWFAALGRIDWAGKYLVDLGSEISPMPWLLATLGAKVTLIEVDEQWVPTWEKLREQLQVNVTWHVVGSEAIPIPSASADAVTSFSVIEHQPNKRAAIDEVARVLKPGGVFAVSFDICEPVMGMTFPEWNGRALTIAEFEETLWLHRAFGNNSRPVWNRDAIEPFLAWHRTTAPHHNYVAAAAVLVKSR